MSQKIFHYSNREVTVIWKPEICIHSGICFRGLPGVFDPRRRPWIEMHQSDSEKIVQQVNLCPSGALTYFLDGAAKDQAAGLST